MEIPKKQTILPRWRGFNLLDMFHTKSTGNFDENDFKWISDFGFDFVRLPLCYLLWIEDNDVNKIHEPMLEKLDRAIELGQKYNIHVNLNFHRGPGYSVNTERKEPFNLWKDQYALDAFCFHWDMMAKRYKDISSDKLSFNLINEPMDFSPQTMTKEDHSRVIQKTVKTIHKTDPNRLIIADGTNWGNVPSPELVDLSIAQSCRAYLPMNISHYKAHWVGGQNFPEPVWPGDMQDGNYWDRKGLEKLYRPWAELAAKGIGIHCGEGGAFSYTPHDVFLKWFRDVLEVLTSYNIGYALWNFRGSFGIMDSGRLDIEYEDFNGHKLDRELLKLLQEF